jgi:hypothetical protein
MPEEKIDDLHGYDAEDRLEAICYKLFGKDLVLRSPVLLEMSGKKELTDILVFIDDTVVIIQSKSMKIDISELSSTKVQRIVNRQNKAKKQINTALNAEKRNTAVKASTPFGVSFLLDWSRIKNKIGIVTLNITDEEYINPEFRFQYPYLSENHNGIEVHTFILNDLEQIAKEINTPADILRYLSCRHKCVISEKFSIDNELDFLAFYKTQYPELESILESKNNTRGMIAPGYWEEYRRQYEEQIKDRQLRFNESIPFDSILRTLVTGIQYAANKHSYTEEESAFNYMLMIGKLSKLTRIERAQIGKKLQEKINKTRTKKWGYFISISVQYKIAYLFLVINEIDRSKRLSFLEYLCIQAIHSFDDFDQIIGISMNGIQDNESSYDTILIEDVLSTKLETQKYDDPVMFKEPSLTRINEWDN